MNLRGARTSPIRSQQYSLQYCIPIIYDIYVYSIRGVDRPLVSERTVQDYTTDQRTRPELNMVRLHYTSAL